MCTNRWSTSCTACAVPPTVSAQGIQYKVAGKTGTAQVFEVAQDEEYDEETVAEKLRDHALFISYAPADNPRIAVAVIVENGGHGSRWRHRSRAVSWMPFCWRSR